MDRYTEPEWSNSALLTVDVQEDFSRPGAPAYVAGTNEIIPVVRRLLDYFRKKNRPVVHLVRLYSKDGSNADLCRRKSIEGGQRVVVPNSDGAELVDEIKPEQSIRLKPGILLKGEAQKPGDREWILYKSRWGGFYQTNLEQMLRRQSISTLVVAGCNFPNCPRTTIYEASERDFRTVLVKDAVSGLYSKGVEELNNIGVPVLHSDSIIPF